MPILHLFSHVFFAVVGANGSLWNIVVHVAVILGLGKLFGFEKKILFIASNANVGGPTKNSLWNGKC
ncbi:hypothetical protein KFK09_025597 [Dendrobium nobile]|uniref:Uncharacterized protein n=1 Tax=Dendrobium nobile TaxID=94219 RepID=A0A8T3A496_DENNO|nr:hypothetical protein KFK09_025597 [Dendrobium nobile]